MKKRWLTVAGIILAVAVAGYWGRNMYLTYQQMRSEVNNRYEHAFQGLNDHVDDLESELGTVLIGEAPDNLAVNLSNIWESTSGAQEDIGELPIASDSLDEVKDLLQKTGQYAKHLEKEVVDGGISEEDKEVIRELHNKVTTINRNLETIHDEMEQAGFRWHDKRRVKIDEDEQRFSITPLAGLLELRDEINVDNISVKLKEVLPAGVIDFEPQDLITSLSQLDGEEIDQNQAVEIAQNFIRNPEKYEYEIIPNDTIDVEGEIVEAHVPAHTVRAVNTTRANETLYFDISKVGGKVISLLNQREVGQAQIDEEEAEDIALQFLEENEFGNLAVSSTRRFNDIMLLSIIPKQNDVLIKPDAINIEVALDNGDIIAYNGLDYILNHREREEEKLEADLSVEEAEEQISNNLDLSREPRLVLAEVDGEEVLSYEFIGKITEEGTGSYLIQINANTGEEERVKSIDQDIYKNVS
ncbi:germination protein YpeB [Natroniella sulfidigena]|uniref:PepSY1/2 domain-containing protein n=1 Tax=Natroniella sulfidigena TaxID=723921 RepID=UPI00200B0733|nr:PepSY1/2 domain-containing protein [Natroniella sulfidigena]MCK8817123.1 germination protein YpeB [Natroniella sulfidigena]